MVSTRSRRGAEHRWTKRGLVIAWLIAGATLISASAGAQNVTSSSIEGTVADQTGGRLPGVTVTASSPAMQVRQLVATTDAEGRYRFVDLQPGVYQIKFELQGFNTLVRGDLSLSAGFTMRVDSSLQLGAAEVLVTVTGEAPVVDATTTSAGQTISTEMIASVLPGSKTVADLVSLTPGLKNTAGENAATFVRPRFNMYGIDSGNTNVAMMVDGFKIIANNPMPDVGTTQEVDVRTFGNGAEFKEVGAAMNMVVKSGGNDVHGEASQAVIRDVSENLDDALRGRNFPIASEIQFFNDVGASLGGPIVHDRFWYFGAWRDRRNRSIVPGLVRDAGPDGVYFNGDEEAVPNRRTGYNLTGKLTFQLTPKYQIQTYWSKDEQTNDPAGSQGAFPPGNGFAGRTTLESTSVFWWRPYVRKGEFKATPTSRFVLDAQYGQSGYRNFFGVQPEGVDKVTRYDATTRILTGSNTPRSGKFFMEVVDASAAYSPERGLAGRHELKFGYNQSRRDTSGDSITKRAGDYALMFDTVNGVAGQPVEIEISNAPVAATSWNNVYAVYLGDQWRASDRVTLNLGLRWDRQHSFVPEQSRAAGQFFGAQTFPAVEVLTYSHLAPRAAIAWDVTGGARSVMKATYGWFNTEAALADAFNANAPCENRYVWTDPNRNRDYDPGEVDLNPNGKDFLSTTCGSNALLAPDLRLSYTEEVTVSFEQQVGARAGIRGLYLYRGLGDQFSSINVLRPYSAYNIPIARRDPGPDGILATADDGQMVTIYDYDAAFRGSSFVGNKNVNRPEDRGDRFQSVEGALAMRFSRQWSMQTSTTFTKYHRWLTSVVDNPNQDAFPLDEAWRWLFKFSANYTLPYNITTGVIVDYSNGLLGQRTVRFARSDASGPALRQLASVTVRAEAFGEQRESAEGTVSLRAAKRFALGKGRDLQFSADVLNLLNANTVTGATYVSGPTFGDATAILPPRQVRASIRFTF